MAKQILNDAVPFGEQRTKINSNFTEVYDGLAERLPEVANYAAVRAINDSNLTAVYVRGVSVDLDGGSGAFRVKEDDTSSIDNGGTILVDAIGRRWFRDYCGSVSVTWFGAKGDGINDDTSAIQAAINSGSKHIKVHHGVNGTYKITNAIYINNPGITLEFDSNNIVLKKYYGTHPVSPGLANCIVVNAAFTKLVNLGIDGNAPTYGGSGIAFNRSDIYYTYGCQVINPRIFNTYDSCIVFFGPRGAPDIRIEGGSLMTYQNPAWSGASSCGFPAIRVIGAQDADTSPRVISGITASSSILVDLTGMWVTRITDCFTGTILFGGNPDVTGITDQKMSCAETSINNTYIRDGIIVGGSETNISNCISHGHAPKTWTNYGSNVSSSSSYGWEISQNSIAVKIGPTNAVSNNIKDYSPQGIATLNLSSYFDQEIAYGVAIDDSASGFNIGNGSVTSIYESSGKYVTARISMTVGSTTNIGSGVLRFSLPYWMNTQHNSIGKFSLYRPYLGWTTGSVILIGIGSTHYVCLLDNTGAYVSASNPSGGWPSGSLLTIDMTYLRG